MTPPKRLVASLVLAAGLVAACGAGGGDSTAQRSDKRTSATVSTSARPANDKPTAITDPCDLLTVDEVASASGFKVGQPSGSSALAFCNYPFPGGDHVQVRFNGEPDAADTFQSNRSVGTGARSVDVGDQAFFIDRNGAADIDVLQGKTLVVVTLFYNGHPSLRAKAPQLLAPLAKAAAGRVG